DPGHRPERPVVVLVLEAGAVHRLQWLREGAAGKHPLRRRALLDQFPGLHGGWRLRRRAGSERDPDGPEEVVGERATPRCKSFGHALCLDRFKSTWKGGGYTEVNVMLNLRVYIAHRVLGEGSIGS